MLSKKILSLSLATGLVISASSSTFAWEGQYESATLPNTTKASTELMNSFTTLVTTKACLNILLEVLHNAINLSNKAQAFYQQLEALKVFDHTANINKLKIDFENLYENDPAFKQAVNSAWVIDVKTGNKQHASIQCINKHTAMPSVNRLTRKYY